MISHLIQLQVVQRQWTPKWQNLVNDLTIIYSIYLDFIPFSLLLSAIKLFYALFHYRFCSTVYKKWQAYTSMCSLSLPISYANRNDKSVIILVQPSIVIAKKNLSDTREHSLLEVVNLTMFVFLILLFSYISNA